MKRSCKLTCPQKVILNFQTVKKESQSHIFWRNLDQLNDSIADDKTGRLEGVVARKDGGDNYFVSYYIPEIASYDGVAGIQEDPRSRDDEQKIVLCFCVDKP